MTHNLLAGAPRGLFIVLEGIDGAGTTTQTERLVSWLRRQGQPVHASREPSDGPIGTLIRQVLRGRVVVSASGGAKPLDPASVALLFAADRLDHLDAEIQLHLDRGAHVVSDRYVYSSLAYQSVELPMEWVREINSRARPPDLTVFLRVPASIGLERIEARQGGSRDLFEHSAFLEEVAQRYEELVDLGVMENALVLDGTWQPERIAAAIRDAVRGLADLPAEMPEATD